MHTHELLHIERCIAAIKQLNEIACISSNDLKDKFPLIFNAANSLDILTHPDPNACTIIHTHTTDFKVECIKALQTVADKWLPLLDIELKKLVDEKVISK